MRPLKLVPCICLLALAQPARSQDQKKPAPVAQGIPGYFNPQTGKFQPMAKVPSEEQAELLLASTGGNFSVTVTITIKSSIPSTDAIACTFSASTLDAGSGREFEDTITVAATGTGSTRKCTPNMFYSWALSSAGSDTVALQVGVSATGTSSSPLPARESFQTLPSMKVPANGSTTLVSVAATL